MKKELFIKYINAIKAQDKRDRDYVFHLSKAFPNAFKGNLFYNNSIIKDSFIELLENSMNDEFKWICYYIYELAFGENTHLGVYDKEGNKVMLKTPEDLYNLIKL